MNIPWVTPTGLAHVRAAFPVGVTLIWTLLYAFEPMAGFLFTLAAVPMIVAWAAIAAFRIASASMRGDWRSSIATSIVFLAVWPVMAVTKASEDYIHLALMYPFYMAQIHEAAEDQPILTVANWGSVGSAISANSDRFLIYDRKGEITAKSQIQPQSNEPAVKVHTDHLLGRFYIRQLFWG